MSKHYIKGLVILVVLDVPHGLWHHNVIGVFFWHDWHVAYVIFPSCLFCSLIRLSLKLFREVCADDLSHFVTSFLVSGDETSQPTSLPCDNKDVRAQTTTITKRFAGLVARYLSLFLLRNWYQIRWRRSLYFQVLWSYNATVWFPPSSIYL